MSKFARTVWVGVACALVSAFLLGTVQRAQARELEDILKSKEIRLGYVNYPPLMIRDPKSGKLSGVYIDALNSVYGAIKIKPVWVEQTWATFAAALQSDQIDVFVGAPFATPQRALALAFTQPFAFMGNDVVVRKEDAKGRFKDVKKLEDLDKPGLTIASPLGGAPYDWLKAHFKQAKIVGVESTNQSQGSLEVLAGRADAAYWDAFVSARDVASHPDQLASLFGNDPLNVSPIAWAIRHHEPELLSFLNTMLEYMDTNGTWLQYEAPYKSELGGYFHVKRTYFAAGGPASQAQIK
ncbi:MAG TPA: transporter substrate-binding domain-containing protein [Stellaceae bacterium]|nr:transporter substrate-binding domain-containing protein [Stellaceae bacterium]